MEATGEERMGGEHVAADCSVTRNLDCIARTFTCSAEWPVGSRAMGEKESWMPDIVLGVEALFN
jgi:hypothetical protein